MKTCFIFNPTSGRNRRRPWLAGAIRDLISSASLDAQFAITEAPGHATELARDAVRRGAVLVVAVGGDGTMNEVAQALLHTPAALALVPCGSGNGLALHLRLPRSLTRALRLIANTADARIAAVDTGSVNGLPFFNAMGLGFDADVSRRFNALTSRGLPAYARTTLAAARALHPEKVAITTSNWRETLDVLILAVANSDQYGNNARIAPGSRVDDGLLDLVAIRSVGIVGAASLAARLFLGNLHRSPHVTRWHGTHFQVERVSAGIIHTDGETHSCAATLEIAVHSRSLRVLLPAMSHIAAAPLPTPAHLALQLP